MKALNVLVAGLLVVDSFLVGHYFGLHSHHVLVLAGSDTHPELWVPKVAKQQAPQPVGQQPATQPPAQQQATTAAATVSAPQPEAIFADFNEAAPRLRSGITTAASLAIIQPSPKETFNPNAPVTRGEFASWLAAARELNLVKPAKGTFADVPPSSPYFTAVEAANKAGLMAGIEDNADGTKQFEPEKSITREDFAVLYATFSNKLKRAENLSKEQIEQCLFASPSTGQETRFTYKDVGDVDDSAYKSVAVAHQAGVLQQAFDVDPLARDSEQRYLRPHQKVTRAEAINVLMKLYGTPEQKAAQ